MIAALSDIHGNLAALQAALTEAQAIVVKRFVVGGDVVDGPFTCEVLDGQLGLGPRAVWLRGNADRDLTRDETWRHSAAGQWEQARLGAAQRDHFAALPITVSLSVPGLGDVLFCHGSPRSDEEIITVLTPDERLRPMLSGVQASTVVCGHTHMPFDCTMGTVRVVNAGSVGRPYGDTAASWLLLGPGVQFRRTAYLSERVLDQVRHSERPEADTLAQDLAAPATAAEATRYFEALATRTGECENDSGKTVCRIG